MNLRNLLLLLVLGLCTAFAREPSATLWTGKCVNKTEGISGQLKLVLFEPGEPDANGVKTVSGYMSVTGWLVGGGQFKGTISKGNLTFATDHLGPISWSGRFGLDSIVGSYSVPAAGDQPAQAGEFEVDKVTRVPGSETEFRQDMMVVIESEYNAAETSPDGKVLFTPQVVFDAIHPVGTGISVQVADLSLEWAESADRTKREGLRRYTTDLFLFWSSPLQSKGVTQLRTIHNAESGQLLSFEVVRTNGTTTAEAKEKAKEIGIQVGLAAGGALLKSWLESK